jgi:uncharacterized protein
MSMMPKHGEFSWTEIATDNLETCRNFYGEVFGWKFNDGDAPENEMKYLEFSAEIEKPIGGMFEMKPEYFGENVLKPHINIYIAVNDADETASKAFDLGGTIISPPMDVPNVGKMCQIEDPTGAKFFVVTLKQ